eukprot:COSAG02_NODE_1595_length_11773_cov_5.122739_3_plen_35_part_00
MCFSAGDSSELTLFLAFHHRSSSHTKVSNEPLEI